MANQRWNPEEYHKSANFVPLLGRPVIELLAPSPGERILDLGCGDGTLSAELAGMGAIVVAVDACPEMVASARAKGLDARAADGERLDFPEGESFDAVMSNAALHWMSDHHAVVRGVWNVLKPGGRFAAECGGTGCVRIIREGMKIALGKRGIDYKSRNPWKYPDADTLSNILETQGFKVDCIIRIDRPTPLPDGLRGWLKIFADRHTEGFSAKEREAFFDDVEDYCRSSLYKDGVWIADYVRLRFLASKPA